MNKDKISIAVFALIAFVVLGVSVKFDGKSFIDRVTCTVTVYEPLCSIGLYID